MLTNSAGTFNDRGRKRTESDAIVEIQTQEIAKLKDTIAGITTENLQIKKACYNKSSVLTTSRFIGIATADPIGFSLLVKCYCVLSLSGTSNGLLLCQTDHIMWHIFLDAATRAFFFGIPLSTSLL